MYSVVLVVVIQYIVFGNAAYLNGVYIPMAVVCVNLGMHFFKALDYFESICTAVAMLLVSLICWLVGFSLNPWPTVLCGTLVGVGIGIGLRMFDRRKVLRTAQSAEP